MSWDCSSLFNDGDLPSGRFLVGFLHSARDQSSGHFFSFFAEKGSGKSECIAWFVEGERCRHKEYEGSGVYK